MKVYGQEIHTLPTEVLQHSLRRYILFLCIHSPRRYYVDIYYLCIRVTKPSLDSPPQRSIKWSAISAQCECPLSPVTAAPH